MEALCGRVVDTALLQTDKCDKCNIFQRGGSTTNQEILL